MSDAQPANPLGSLAQSTLTLILRHGLSAVAGALALHGILSKSQSAQFVDGGVAVAVWLFPVVWSYLQKKLAHKTIDDLKAQATSVPTTAAAST